MAKIEFDLTDEPQEVTGLNAGSNYGVQIFIRNPLTGLKRTSPIYHAALDQSATPDGTEKAFILHARETALFSPTSDEKIWAWCARSEATETLIMDEVG